MKYIQLVALIFIPLLVGMYLYFLAGNIDIQLFDWVLFKDLKVYVSFFEIESKVLPNWIVYNLPDCLWIFSFTSLIIYIWKGEISNVSKAWIFFPLLLAYCFEFGQKIEFINGTFDKYDLLAYTAGSVFSVIFNLKFNNLLTFKSISK